MVNITINVIINITKSPKPSLSTIIVNQGVHTISCRLPCIVDRLEGFVMLWKRGKDIITVASQIIDQVWSCVFVRWLTRRFLVFFSDHQVFSKKKEKRFFLESNLFEQFPPRGSFGQINCYNGRAKKNESDKLRCWKKKVISFSFIKIIIIFSEWDWTWWKTETT